MSDDYYKGDKCLLRYKGGPDCIFCASPGARRCNKPQCPTTPDGTMNQMSNRDDTDFLGLIVLILLGWFGFWGILLVHTGLIWRIF